MILKGSQRGGPRQLAAHLLNDKDNDHVTVQDVRGFVSGDLFGAMAETVAIAKGTRCRQPVFSLSLNPPKDANVSLATFVDAADRAEMALGLQGQPRAIVVHEKEGRHHAHVVWSRIDAEEMKAINLPWFKTKLNALSKELYLEHGWALPEGLRENGWKNPLNFSLAEWQQAQRLELDPREIKQVFRAAFDQSDGLKAFRSALEDHGYYLAKGDRRGVVALDMNGEVFSVTRWAGVKTKQIGQKIGTGDGLPSVETVRTDLRTRVTDQMRSFIEQDKTAKSQEMQPLIKARKDMIERQRQERKALKEVHDKRTLREVQERAARFRRGLGVVMDILTGRLFKLKRQNQSEALAGMVRDRSEREHLVQRQFHERKFLHQQIQTLRTDQQSSRLRLVERIADRLRRSSNITHTHDQTNDRSMTRRLTP